jgi:hypothetical protein
MVMATSVLATLNYLKPDPKWDVEKPYTLFVDISKVKGASVTNIEKISIPDIPVEDVRGKVQSLSMDKNGFEVVNLNQTIEHSNFDDDGWVHAIYYPAICQLVKDKLAAKDVKPYQHKVCACFLD